MTISDEPALLDTNVLVYAADAGSPFHDAARELRDRGVRGEIPLVVSPQVLLEFFAVITHPRRVHTPRSPQEASAEMAKYLRARRLRTIYPGPDLLQRVLALHAQHPHVARQDIFDLALVATMLANGMTRIYTYNQQHFAPFHELTVLTP
jgi:toxin-antitoxin system PIN domain toxin